MCVVWGIPYLFIKVAVRDVSVPMVVFTRSALGALLLLPLALRSGQLGGLRRYWRPLLAFATLEIIVPWGLLSAAEQRLPSSLAGLLIAAVPIIGVVVARLTGGTERLSPRRWTGLIIGLAGVAVLAAPDLGSGNGWAIGEVLLVAVCYASAPLIATRKLADVPALPMTAACLTLAALVYTPAAAVTWPRQLPSAQVLAALAGLGVICTACRVHRVPRTAQGGRHVAGHGVHLRQPGGGGRGRASRCWASRSRPRSLCRSRSSWAAACWPRPRSAISGRPRRPPQLSRGPSRADRP